MKEHKSSMSMVARFAYIFATIVTVFAQMGAAVPAVLAGADSGPTGIISTDGMKMTFLEKQDYLYTVQIDGEEPANGQSFKVRILGTGMTLNDTKTNQNNGEGTEKINSIGDNVKVFTGWRVVNNGDGTLTITRNDNYTENVSDTFDGKKTVTPWPMKISFVISKSGASGGVELDGSGEPTTINETNTLGLSVFDNGPTTYQVGDEIDLQVSDQKMISGGEVDVNKETISSYLKFDFDKTAALLKKEGYTQSEGDSTELSELASDSGSTTNYKFTNDDGSYFYLLDNGGDARIAWPASNGSSTRMALIAMDAEEQSSSVSLTPNYLSTSLSGQDGTGVKLTIKQAPEVDGSALRLDPHSVANDKDGGVYRMSTFPLFYMKETNDSGTQLYSFIYNNNSTGVSGGAATHSLEQLRQAILFGSGYASLKGGGAGSTTNNEPAFFENFHEIGSDGYAVAGSEKKFDVDKTYTMIPYNPLTTGSDRFKRINGGYASDNYYMPDGVPTFSLDASGNITLQSQGDGNAVKGQWSATGKTINAALYKIKKLKVVDQNGDPVTGATLTLKNTTSGDSAYMQASTTSDGTGEFLPNDYDDANKGPFYYADGTQAFDKLTLPSDGYSQDVSFSGMTISSKDDTLSLSDDKKNAAITDDGQTLTLTVHKYDAKDTDINIKKVAKADDTKALGGATFHVEEVDGASDAIATKDVDTDDSDGLATLTADATSTTTKRVFHITETKAPKGYLIANTSGYYATWTKGSGFTVVGDTQDATGTKSSDALATVKDGQLVIQDPDAYSAGGADSKMRLQYVDSAEYLKAGSGTKIAGAQLPVLKENQTFSGTGLAGFSGLGGVIYSPDTDPSTLMKADSGIASGTLANDGSMYTSTEKSGTDGLGYVQGLWSQTGLIYGWEGLDNKTNGWILSNAVVNGTVPSTPMIGYQLLSPAQRQRAVGTTASGYYNLGGTLTISGDGTTITIKNDASNKLNNKDRDNSVKASGNTAQVELYKVKHVQVVDTAGNKVPNAVVKFSNMTGTTGSDGSNGELLPNDVNNQPTTKGDNFVFPIGNQKLQSVTDTANKALTGADGKALDNSNGFYFVMGDKGIDQLQGYSGSNVKVIDSGQTVQVTVKAPTTIKIHKQDFINADKALAGATFKVWADGDETNAVTTPAATDDNGDTSVTLANASANDSYHIQEVTAPDDYQLDDTDYSFTWTAKAGVSAVTDTTSHVLASGGVLHFADLKTGSGGVGDNGTNGGTLTVDKVDLSDASATVPDGAEFTLSQTMGGSLSDTQTTANGKVSFNVGDATTTDKVFKITETTAPTGYTKAANSYLLRIQADGTMTLGAVDTLNTDITADYTADNVIKFASSTDHTLVFGDVKDTNNNGGLFSLKKIDASNAAVTPPDGAEFHLKEVGTGAAGENLSDITSTTSGGIISFDLGTATNITRNFTLTEQVAPLGYVWNTQQYAIKISVTGVVTVGVGQVSSSPTMSTTQTTDGVLAVAGKGITFADAPVTTQKNGGQLTIKKVDTSDRTLGVSGALFGASEAVNGDINYLGTDNGVTSDAQGNFSLQLGQPTNTTRTIKLQEVGAPTGYQANSNAYYLKIAPDGTVNVITASDQTAGKQASTSTADGVLQVDGQNQLTFGDTLTPVTSSFTIKKTALSDRKTAITTNLNDASFSATEIALTGTSTLGDFALQSSGSTNTITTSKSSNLTRLVKIQETKAPTGYVLSTTPYYVTLSATGGVVGVSQEAATSTKQQSADGVVQIDDNKTVNFGDAVQGPTVSIKKIAAGTTQGLSGAKFTLTDLGTGFNSGASQNSTISAVSASTGSDGVQKFNVVATPSGQSLRMFKVVETQAPSGYLLNSKPYYVLWSAAKGVYGIGTSPTEANQMKQNASDSQASVTAQAGDTPGYANVSDKPDVYSIAALRRTGNADENGKPVGNVQVTLSSPSGTNGTAQTITTDPATGTVDVTPAIIAKALGLTTDQMKGSVDVRLDVADTGSYASPVSRIVRFTFAGGSTMPGFAVYGMSAPSSSDTLKANDQMVEDSNATDYSVSAGNLALLMRKDTLSAAEISGNNEVGSNLANVSFEISMTFGNQTYRKVVTTKDDGQVVLPDPNTLFGVKDVFTPMSQGTMATVTVKQTGTLNGYMANTDDLTGFYTTSTGYQFLSGSITADASSVTNSIYDESVLSIVSVMHTFGGSAMTFYLTKELDSLNLDSVPESMNFGRVEAQSQVHDYPLLNASDVNQATFDTSTLGLSDPNVATSESNGVMSAQVTQNGDYEDGWRLQLSVGDLTSEDGSDTVKNAQINFANDPTVTKDGVGMTNDGLTSRPKIAMGSNNATDMFNTGTNAKAGVYKVNMPVSDVAITIPMYSGIVKKNYQAPMTWTLDDTPTE